MKNKIFFLSLTIIAILLLPAIIHAQPGFGGGEDVVDTPIDGGLTLLIAAGVGYGTKKLKKNRK